VPVSLLGERNFRRYWAARMVSIAGSLVTYVVLPVLIYQVTRSSLWTAFVVVAEGLAYLAFGLFAGAVADRVDRRRLMIGSDLVNATVLGTVPLAYVLDVLTAPHVVAVAFLTQILFVFFDAANFGALPALVGRDRIANANSTVYGGGTVLELVVPGLAGALIAVAAPAPLLAIDAVSFVVSALLVRAIRAPLQIGLAVVGNRLRNDIGEGLAFLWRQPVVRIQTMVGSLQAMAGGAFMGQFVPWLDQVLRVRPSGDARLGVMFGVWGAGGILAAVLFPWAARRLGEGWATLVFLPLSATFGVACALASNWLAAAVLLGVWAVAYSTVVLNAITARQRVTPDALQSRVSTAARVLSFGVGWPIGALGGGVIAEAAGPRLTMITASGLVVMGAVAAWLSPLRRLRWIDGPPGSPSSPASASGPGGEGAVAPVGGEGSGRR
jgi:predicted MFS family arabinose efflux permease